MENTYIKNDNGELRVLYWLALNGITKQPYQPKDYKWPWVYCLNGIMQHAPDRKYIRNKTELTITDFK